MKRLGPFILPIVTLTALHFNTWLCMVMAADSGPVKAIGPLLCAIAASVALTTG